MPHALLLSPDDQAVSAITGVLEEMSVTCERPLDGVSAAQKLNSQSFDLVLVDCENLPAAKLIFDVCRRGKNGNHPIPIAIVDGRAGLPTAFRLGAELILTKPVAKDQARSTIRTAVSRVQKVVETNKAENHDAAAPEDRTLVAVACSEPTNRAESDSAYLSNSISTADSYGTLTAPPLAIANTAASELGLPVAAPRLNLGLNLEPTFSSTPLLPTIADSVNAKLARAVKTSDDAIRAELDTMTLEKAAPAEATLESTGLAKDSAQPLVAKPSSATTSLVTPSQVTPLQGKPAPAPHRPSRQKPSAPLTALLMLTLAGGGFYAAWIYQPGFRDIAKPQIDRLFDLAGKALPPSAQSAAKGSAKPSAQVTAPKVEAPAAQAAAVPASASQPPTASSAPNSASTSARGTITSSATSAAATTPMPAATLAGAGSVSPKLPVRSAAPTFVIDSRPHDKKDTQEKKDAKTGSEDGAKDNKDTKKDVRAAVAAQPTIENAEIILSSKGAEKRLAHSVPPTYPAASSLADGQPSGPQQWHPHKVVLKAVIDANGNVVYLQPVEGDAALASAAIAAVKQWRYQPYVRNGKAQPFQTLVILDSQRP